MVPIYGYLDRNKEIVLKFSLNNFSYFKITTPLFKHRLQQA